MEEVDKKIRVPNISPVEVPGFNGHKKDKQLSRVQMRPLTVKSPEREADLHIFDQFKPQAPAVETPEVKTMEAHDEEYLNPSVDWLKIQQRKELQADTVDLSKRQEGDEQQPADNPQQVPTAVSRSEWVNPLVQKNNWERNRVPEGTPK